MKKQLITRKQNSLHIAYTWNMLINVRPYSAAVSVADDCDFTGRLGQLEPNIGRSHCKMVT